MDHHVAATLTYKLYMYEYDYRPFIIL